MRSTTLKALLICCQSIIALSWQELKRVCLVNPSVLQLSLKNNLKRQAKHSMHDMRLDPDELKKSISGHRTSLLRSQALAKDTAETQMETPALSLTSDPFSLKNSCRGPAGSFAEQYEHSISDPEGFWSAVASSLYWFKKPEKILDYDSRTNLSRWFVDGQINVCYNALDLHVKHSGRGDQVALIYDSPVTNTKKKFTYKELLDEVSRFAAVLIDEYGLKRGDRAVIYMPMIPEAVISMLACARIGVVHSVVFGGFAPKELATRIDDCEPKLIISASCGVEQGGKITPYMPLVDDAIEKANHKVSNCIIVQRDLQTSELKEGRDASYQDLMSKVDRAQSAIPVNSTDPLYILYTSGTTGKPKGVIRDTGGLAVGLKWSMSAFYDTNPGEVYFAGSDIGWVVGHHYIVYAPLLQGCATVLYEGKPVFTPDAGAFWRLVEEYKIKTLFAAPTAFRAIKQLDPHGLLVKAYNISSLNAVFLAGERSDPDTLRWCEHNLGVPAIDHWWQTELAYAGTGNALGLGLLPPKYGACTGPVPGYDIRVLNEEGIEVPRGTLGDLVIKLPLPPGSLLDLYKNTERCMKAYLEEHPGYYNSGDAGFIDEDGYIHIMARSDDVINTAGHRISTGALEQILLDHPDVADCAVIGVNDAFRGQVPVGFVVLNNGSVTSEQSLQQALVSRVREAMGSVAAFKKVRVVRALPKTRSGKILRGTMRAIANGEPWTVAPTIDDPKIFDELGPIIVELVNRKS